jgi:hypothetical protein
LHKKRKPTFERIQNEYKKKENKKERKNDTTEEQGKQTKLIIQKARIRKKKNKNKKTSFVSVVHFFLSPFFPLSLCPEKKPMSGAKLGLLALILSLSSAMGFFADDELTQVLSTLCC